MQLKYPTLGSRLKLLNRFLELFGSANLQRPIEDFIPILVTLVRAAEIKDRVNGAHDAARSSALKFKGQKDEGDILEYVEKALQDALDAEAVSDAAWQSLEDVLNGCSTR